MNKNNHLMVVRKLNKLLKDVIVDLHNGRKLALSNPFHSIKYLLRGLFMSFLCINLAEVS